jgi:hypothetical protein
MSEDTKGTSGGYVTQYLRGVLEDRMGVVQTQEGEPLQPRGAGHIAPSFWADAPWRLEPDQDEIPFTFIVRDAAKAKMDLEEIAVYEAPDDGQPWEEKAWRLVHTFTEGMGRIDRQFWTYRPAQTVLLGPPPTLPVDSLETAARGQRLLLKIVCRGSQLKLGLFRQALEQSRSLTIFLAKEALPLRDTAQWYYGDTHYHSDYTNDVKEFGNPVPDTRAAAERIGLDWLVITDHSVDLADENPYWEVKRTDHRWDDLGLEVQENSDERFRLLRGEEVTLLGMPGKGDDTLHMLVFGDEFHRLIPGAFAKESLLSAVADRLLGFARELYEHLFGPIYGLEAVLTGVDHLGQAEPALKGCSVQHQRALAFAAHPATIAQAPGGTWEFHDLMQPVHGMEAWNTRKRRTAREQDRPFDDWKKSGTWKEGSNKEGIDIWDQILRQKVGLPDPRFVLLAGSDAHGSFNFSEGWWIDSDGFIADDNCLGKVRTLIYLPGRDGNGSRRAPEETEIVDAIRSGSCVVTDGPVLNFTVGHNGTEAKLGQILTAEGEGALEVSVQAASTDEFGAVEQVEVLYYFRGMDGTVAQTVDFQIGHSEELSQNLPSGPGYVRLATTTHIGEETYRCFTNPVWIKSIADGNRGLRVNCVAW